MCTLRDGDPALPAGSAHTQGTSGKAEGRVGLCRGCDRATQLQSVWLLSFLLSGVPPTLVQVFLLLPFFGSAHNHLSPGLLSGLPDNLISLLCSCVSKSVFSRHQPGRETAGVTPQRPRASCVAHGHPCGLPPQCLSDLLRSHSPILPLLPR